MGDTGFLVSVGGDSSDLQRPIAEVQAALGNLSKSMKPAAEEAASASKPLDDALLNQHQSVHLLADELGVHLPRAVVGGIAEMLPHVESFGGALLGAFAVKEVAEFAGYVKADSEAVEGLAKAERDLKDAAKANLDALKNESIERLAMDLQHAAIRQADDEREYQRIRRIAENEAALLPGVWHVYDYLFRTHIKDHLDEMKATVDSDKALVDQLNGFLADANKKTAEANSQAADEAREKATKAAEAMQQDQEKLDERINEEAKKIWAERMSHYEALQVAIYKTRQAEMQLETSDAAAGLFKPDPRDAETQKQMIDNLEKEIQLTMKVGAMALPLTRGTQEQTDAQVHLNAVRQASILISQEMTDTAKHEVEEVSKHLLASTQQLAGSVAGLIAGRRAAAAVEVPFEIAEGIKCLAIGAWPPNPAAYVAAGLHFEAAAAYAKIAGTSAHRPGGAGGRAGSLRSGTDHGGGYGGSERDRNLPQTLAPGAQGSRFNSPGSGVVILHGDDAFTSWAIPAFNKAVTEGSQFLTSTVSQRGAPVGH